MPATEKRQPVEGHKCKGARMWFSVSCECGWHSVMFHGEGARAQAYSEWRNHVAKCAATHRGLETAEVF